MNERENLVDITISAGLIKQTVAQIETLEEQKAQIIADMKDVFDSAKSQGLDVKILKRLISLRKKKQEDLIEEEELLEIYKKALEQ